MDYEHQVPLEIEQNFLIPDDIEARLDSLKAVKVKELKLCDVYLDTASNCLVLSDMWLRRRNGNYELKYPPQNKMGSDVDQYQETADKCLIEQLVFKQLAHSLSNSKMPKSLEELVPFMELTTYRKEYRLGDNISIVLDETNYGYNIGEVEVISLTPETQQQGVEEVERAIADLRVQTVGRAEGKTMHYLAKFNSPLLDKIRSKLKF
ncbi:thiamine-triphosphatase-like [Watersipora subatra]|uniref:thiamine-triphosphatase-like n=1 Tax=Watersipora subatra TaxID=2589382 RepID=UPI00355B5790